MLKNGLEMLENYDIMSGGGEGSAEVQPKAQVWHFILSLPLASPDLQPEAPGPLGINYNKTLGAVQVSHEKI